MNSCDIIESVSFTDDCKNNNLVSSWNFELEGQMVILVSLHLNEKDSFKPATNFVSIQCLIHNNKSGEYVSCYDL